MRWVDAVLCFRVPLKDDASYLREGVEVSGGVFAREISAHGEAGKTIRVAFGVCCERGEVAAGGQHHCGVFADCGGVQSRHRFISVGVAGQVVEENPRACWRFRGLGAGRVIVGRVSKSVTVERGLVNMLLVPSGHADSVADGAADGCAGDVHVVACCFGERLPHGRVVSRTVCLCDDAGAFSRVSVHHVLHLLGAVYALLPFSLIPDALRGDRVHVDAACGVARHLAITFPVSSGVSCRLPAYCITRVRRARSEHICYAMFCRKNET